MPRRRIALSALFVFVLMTSFLPFSRPVMAESDYRWRRIATPSEGAAGGWMLAKGSDVKCLTLAKDGTLYAYANPTGTPNRLFKSKDNGASWSSTGDVTVAIVDIAAAPDDAAFIYYATTSAIYRSSDAGAIFIQLPSNPGGAGAGNVEITAIDVGQADRGRITAVATRDRDAGQFGGVYTLDESAPFAWQDTFVGPFDVYSLAFSPDYFYDRRLVAVVNNEVDTFVSVKIGTSGWGTSVANARLSQNNAAPIVSLPSLLTGCIDFPDNASGEPSRGSGTFFVGVNTGTGAGDVYRIDNANFSSLKATDLNTGTAGSGNIDIGALAAFGQSQDINQSQDIKLFAGAAQDTRIYVSNDSGKNWDVCEKAPTGSAVTGLIAAADFGTGGKLFSTTSGTESAFSVSRDAGLTWNQNGLIDTQIAANDIADILASSDYAGDNTLFLLAAGTKYGLYRSLGGIGWERVLSGALPGVDSLGKSRLSPAYSKGQRVIYVSGVSSGAPALWRSVDAGEKWSKTSAPFNIDVMAILDDKTVFIGGQSGGSAFVAISDNGGFVFGPKVSCGTAVLKSLALSPDYAVDKTIIAGNSDGWVYCSSDGGISFKPLPPDAAARPLSGAVSVAFDHAFAKNRIVYAASNTLNAGVFRFTQGKSQTWEKIDNTLPTASSIAQIGVSAEGAIYAINNKADGGMERSVEGVVASSATFETFTDGLPAGAKLNVMAVSVRRFFAWDAVNGYLLTVDDVLTGDVPLASPADEEQGVGMLINHQAHNVALDWETVTGATSYEWQLSPTTDFSAIASGYGGTTEATRAVLPVLEPAAAYNWRVRVSQPVHSLWSETRTFATSLGEIVMAPQVVHPTPAASGISRQPIFQWNAVAGADGYELVVGNNTALATLLISRSGDNAIAGNAWESNVLLEYGTTYYWKVRGVSTASMSAWSNVSTLRNQ